MLSVFVSFSHESTEHVAAVRTLCGNLVEVGIDVVSDGYVGSPGQGWFDWSLEEIAASTHLVTVCTAEYRRRFEVTEIEGIGHGVSWEARAIRQHLVQTRGRSTKVVPVLLEDEPESSIPKVLHGKPWARVRDGDVRDLVALLRGLPRWPKPAAGSDWLRALGMALPSIVGPDRFVRWARKSLEARDFGDGNESLIDYGLAVVRDAHARDRIDEAWWQTVLRRYGSHTEHAEELNLLYARWAEEAEATGQAEIVRTTSSVPKPEPDEKTTEEVEAEHTAVVLDRTQAWKTLREGCTDARHSKCFIVYGTWQQDLGLFMERIESYFCEPQENPVYHDVVPIPTEHGVSRVRSADDWERAVVGATKRNRGPLASALARQARQNPVLLLLGSPRPLRKLDDRQRRGLREFLTSRLPAALRGQTSRRPVHVVVPLELSHEDETEVVDELEAAFDAVESGLELVEPVRLVPPDWREIRKHVELTFATEGLVAGPEVLRVCKQLFQKINAESPNARLRDLGNRLHRELYDWLDRAHRG